MKSLILLIFIPSIIAKSADTLKDAAKGTGLNVGTKLQFKWNRSDKETMFERIPLYEQLVKQEYDFVTINSCTAKYDIGKNVKSLDVSKMDDELDFYNCQYMIDWAEANNMTYRLHGLNWFKQHADLALLDSDEYTLDEKKLYLREYTKKNIMELGPDASMYDVVKEFIADGEDGGKRNFIPGVITEKEMPDIACEIFIAAKEARQEILCGKSSDGVIVNCDAAKDHTNLHLLYNDYGHSCMKPCNQGNWDKAGRVFNLIEEIVEKRCGIDSVGFQMHINRFYSDFDGLRRNIQRYADLGISVHFTEVDVRCGATSGSTACELDINDPDAEWSDEMLQDQSYVYGEILQVCLEEPNCDAFVMWDAMDGVAPWSQTLPPMNPYLFDKNGVPKPAYFTVLNKLNEFPRDHPSIESRITGSWRKAEVYQPFPVTGPVEAPEE